MVLSARGLFELWREDPPGGHPVPGKETEHFKGISKLWKDTSGETLKGEGRGRDT